MDCFHVNQVDYNYSNSDIYNSDEECSNSYTSHRAIVDYGYPSTEDDDDDHDEEVFLTMIIEVKIPGSVYFSKAY